MIELAYIGAGVGLALFSIVAYNFVRHRVHKEDRTVRGIVKWLPESAVVTEASHSERADGTAGTIVVVWKRTAKG